MTYQIEFPDYPVADMPSIPAGFVDVSWHNDACLSFMNEERRLVIWCDFADPAMREYGDDHPRFSLNRTDECGAFESDVWAGDDFGEVLVILATMG